MAQGQPDEQTRANASAAAAGEAARQLPHIPDHKLLRRIGSGSYGVVWLASNVIGTLRAVKIVHRARFDNDRPYEREYLGIQKFEPISRSHEGLVDILQVGRNDEGSYFYYVMELADDANSSTPVAADVRRLTSKSEVAYPNSEIDQSLLTSAATYQAKTLRSEIQRRGRFPVDECVALGLSLARALARLHAQGLVHRDIKPSNIIFVGGVPKLADIGLVTDAGEACSYVGTEGFIPPEGPGTPAADLYSLGKVLYETSTGKDRHEFPEPLTNLGEQPDKDRLLELNAILHRACQSDPRERYRSAEEMVAELELLQRGESVKRKRVAERRWAVFRRTAVAAAALVLLAAGVWLLANRFTPSAPQRSSAPIEVNSLAVLPFVRLGTGQPHEYLCSALTEETISALTNCAGLRVAPWSSVMPFQGRTNEFAEAGRQLGVRTVLTADFLRRSNSMTLKARLLNVADDAELWSASITRKKEELGPLGSDLARRAAQALHVSLPDAAVSAMETNLQWKLQAYQFFTAASRRLEFDVLTKSNFTEAVSLWQQALSADQNCVPAHLGLGYAYIHFSGWHLAPREGMPTARSHFLRVLELDPTSAQARSRLGFIRLHFDYDWAGAEKDVRRAVEMDRGNLVDLLPCLWVRGQWEEAEALAKERRRRFPNQESTAWVLAFTYCFQRRYDLALEQTKWILDRNLNSVSGNYMEIVARMGRGEFPEALAALARVKAVDDRPDMIALEGYIYGRMGRVEDARRTLEELDRLSKQRFVSRICWAMVYTGLDDRQKALQCLEAAYDERHQYIMYLNVHPFWDSLRNEPGFISLVQRLGLGK